MRHSFGLPVLISGTSLSEIVSRFAHKVPGTGPSSLLIAIGAFLAVGLVFLLLPLAGGLQEEPEADVTVRDVDIITLPEPPEEQPEPQEVTNEVPVATPQLEQAQRVEAPNLSPLAVEGSGPAMPVASVGDMVLPEFPMMEAPSAMPEVFAINEVDVRPVALVQKLPVYPLALQRQRVEGEAVVRFIIDAEGRVGDITVESASHESFGEASEAAIRQWRYKPAEKDGRPVSCTVRIPMPFNLR